MTSSPSAQPVDAVGDGGEHERTRRWPGSPARPRHSVSRRATISCAAPRSSAMNQRAMRSKRGHQRPRPRDATALGPKHPRPISTRSRLRNSGSRADERERNRSSAACTRMPSSARPGLGVELVERLQVQHVAGIDRVGIADPGLDLRSPTAGAAAPPAAGAARRPRSARRVRLLDRSAAAQRDDLRQAGPSAVSEADRAQHRIEPQQPARRHRRRCPPRRVARVSTTVGAPSACAKSCAAMPMRALRQGEAEFRAHRPRHPRVGSAVGPGQVPSLSPPRTSRSACCSRASSGPQIASRGCRP